MRRFPTMTRGFIRSVICVASLLGVASSAEVEAQEVQLTGPLKGAPAVRHLRLYREGRLQVAPQVGFTLQDEYSRAIMLGGQLSYHFTDWIGLGVWGSYAVVNSETGLTGEVAQRGQTTSRNLLSLPTADGFPDQIAQINWMAAVQANFIPLRGKLALFQEIFLDSDFYLFGGLAAIGLTERADADGSCATGGDLCQSTQSERASRIALAPTFGAGLTVYPSSFWGVALEWRALPFAWNTSGTDERGLNASRQADGSGEFPDGQIDSDDQIYHFNHMISLGLVFYLPTDINTTP